MREKIDCESRENDLQIGNYGKLLAEVNPNSPI